MTTDDGDKAVFTGHYADLKFIKTRGVCQVVIEVPIEHQTLVQTILGPLSYADPATVAVARLALPGAKAQQPQKQPAHSATRQAAIMCGTAEFRQFLAANYDTGDGPPEELNSERAGRMVRELCAVESRAEFDTDVEARARWDKLYTVFLNWRRE